MVGLLNRPGLAATVTKGTAPSAADDNNMDAVYRQITRIRQNSFMEPDAIVISPTAWQDIVLSKNAQGAYYANGPFVGQQPETLWGKRVVQTAALTAGNALVGAFAQGAQMFAKGGITVEASNSHADFFQRNKTAIRAERRLGLAVYRPGAFGLVAGL
jgi:HK97 family phage major capsid protein